MSDLKICSVLAGKELLVKPEKTQKRVVPDPESEGTTRIVEVGGDLLVNRKTVGCVTIVGKEGNEDLLEIFTVLVNNRHLEELAAECDTETGEPFNGKVSEVVREMFYKQQLGIQDILKKCIVLSHE